LKVPANIRPAHLFSWLEEIAPAPEEHDYVLSTDGSGCARGWGSSTSIIQEVYLGEFCRVLGKYQPIINASYGSTVQRREFSALLDGLHEILRLKMGDVPEVENDGEPKLDARLHFTRDNRITVLWYTDRANLAKSLLFDEDNAVLNKRTTETDLWMRYASFARFFCITPMWTDRNLIPAQKMCDTLCDIARNMMMNTASNFSDAIGLPLHESWNQQRPQKATF
jgi:hypothetical protein